jgi:hypothetical protein
MNAPVFEDAEDIDYSIANRATKTTQKAVFS